MSPASQATRLSGTNSFCVYTVVFTSPHGDQISAKAKCLETFARRVCCNYTWYYDFKNPSQLINIQFNTNVGEIGKTNSIPVRGDGAFMWEIFIPLHWDHLTQGGISHDQADPFPIWTRNDFSYKRHFLSLLKKAWVATFVKQFSKI